MTESILGNILQKIIGVDQDKAKRILDTIPAGISIATDASCKEVIHNSKAAEFLRIKSWEVLSITTEENQPVKMFHNGRELTPAEMPLNRSAWEGEEIKDFEIEFIWDDGVYKAMLSNSSPLFDESGSIIGAIASFEDITTRKELERDLLEKEQECRHKETLLERNECLKALMDYNPSLIFLKDECGRYVYLNRTYEQQFVGSKDWYGKTDFDFWSKESAELFRANDLAVLETGRVTQYLEDSKDLDGTRYCWLNYKFPYTDSKNRRYSGGIGIDVTKRILAEEALRKAEEELQRYAGELKRKEEESLELIDSFTEGSWIIDIVAGTIKCSEKWEKRIGLDLVPEEERLSYTHTLSHPDDTAGGNSIQYYMETGAARFELEYRIKTVDSGYIWTQNRGKIVYNEQGKAIKVYAATIDITERKKADEKLAYQARIIDEVHDAVIATDMDFSITYWNKAAERIYGWTPEEALGINADVLLANSVTRKEEVSRLMQKGIVEFETTHVRKDGSRINVATIVSLVYDHNGQPSGTVGVLLDVTEHIKAEEALRESEQRFRAIQDNSLDHFTILKPFYNDEGRIVDFTYVYQNAHSAKTADRRPEELVGHRMTEIFPSFPQTSFSAMYKQAVEIGQTLEFEDLYNSDGMDEWFRATVTPVPDGIAVAKQIITERKRAEEILKRDKQQLEEIVKQRTEDLIDLNQKLLQTIESITDAFFTLDTECRVTYWNNAAEKMFKLERKDILGRIFWEVFPEAVGSEFYYQYHLAMRENKPVKFEALGPYTGRWVEARVYPSGLGLTIYLNDITERKLLEKEITRLDRLNLVGEMAAGIGHEVRNPMTAVRGFLQLLGEKERYAQDRDYFELMVEELDRANSIITEFLSLAKNKAVDLEMKNLNKILKSILPMMQADGLVTDKYIKLETKKIPDILLDEKEIRQLVLNLVRNGLQAMEPGKTLTLETYMEEDIVVLAVKDQGTGIPDEIIDKIGTPFFTTKDHGTGLGLAVCYSIAARHNVVIDIETGPEGTTFFIRFKRSE